MAPSESIYALLVGGTDIFRKLTPDSGDKEISEETSQLPLTLGCVSHEILSSMVSCKVPED